MLKLSIISTLALLCTIGCEPREKVDSVSIDNRGNCKAAFLEDYQNVETLIAEAYKGRVEKNLVIQACADFKAVHRNTICKVSKNGVDVYWKAMTLNQECETFRTNSHPE